jgi:PAS domain S-box-containing protein
MDACLRAAMAAVGIDPASFAVQLFDRAPVAFVLHDKDFRCIHLNPAAAQLFGCRAGERSDPDWTELGLEDDTHPFRAATRRLIAGETAVRFDCELSTRAGARVVCEWNVTALHKDGVLVGAFSLVHDVTQRHETAAALRVSQTFLEEAQAVADVGHWTSDVFPGDRLIWSRQIYRIFGITEARFDGRVGTFFSFVHPDDRGPVKEAVAAAVSGERPYAIELRIIRPDGSMRWVHARAVVTRDEQGEPLRLLGVVQDITERKRIEDELRRSERRFRALIEHGSDIIQLHDSEGTLLYASPSVTTILGYAPEEIIGGRPSERIHPDDLPLVADAFAAAMRGDSRPVEYRIRHKQGGWRWMRGSGRNLARRRSRCRGFLGHPGRRHRTPPRRRAISSGPEDGGDWPPRRRRRPRLQ